MMRTKIGIAIVASVVFAAVCIGAYSAERDDASTAKVVPTPARAVRTPARPGQVIEEEAPSPRPAARPVRVTPPRAPARTTPTRPSARTSATPRRPVRPAPDPHKDSVILVEAFMVQVQLSALHSLGVPQISEGCKSVSAEHIIKLMKTTDAAVVTAGSKVMVGQKNKAETKSTTRQPILTGPPEKKRIQYMEVGTQFTAITEVRRVDKIFAEMEFEHITIEEGNGKTDREVLVGRDFSSSVFLQNGKPTLVGASQDKETGTFLIVTATIQK